MNRPIFAILAGFLSLSMISTLLVAATAGGQQTNNYKWQTFEVVRNGGYTAGKNWYTPPPWSSIGIMKIDF